MPIRPAWQRLPENDGVGHMIVPSACWPHFERRFQVACFIVD
ncbi:hypothetical protein [Eikenella corrodens]|nr:hypothetical protein [Eikenella corrodens]